MAQTQQKTFDGETISDHLIKLSRFAVEHWGKSTEEAHEFFAGLSSGDLRSWRTFTTAEGAGEVDFEKAKACDPSYLGWALEEWELSPEEAPDYALVNAVDGDPLPAKVIKAMDNPVEWEVSWLSPENVGVMYEPGDIKLWYIVVDGEEAYVDKSGYVYDADYFDYVGDSPEDMHYTYRDDIDVIHHDFTMDHVTTVAVADGEHEKFILESRSGVMWERDPYAEYAGDLHFALAEALSDGVDRDIPDGYVRVKAGWHSSLERSELSDRINALTSGEVHKVMGWDKPVAVKFGTTRNICSMTLGVYAPEEYADDLDEILNKKAAPWYAGW